MIHLHMSPALSHIRVYVEADGYKNRIPYEAMMTVVHMSDTMVYLMGAVGTVNRETWNKAFEMLYAQGVKTVILERRGVMRVAAIERRGRLRALELDFETLDLNNTKEDQ